MREQEKILRVLIDNLPDGIFLKDTRSRFLFANRIVAELMGQRDAEILIGRTDHDFYSRDVADGLRAEEQRLLDQRQPNVNVEELKSLPSGTRRILTTKVPVIDDEGTVTGLLGITRDVTDRREYEESLLQGQARYRGLLEQAVDGIFLLDADGRFLMTNVAIREMLGYSDEELRGMSILDTYPPALRDAGKERFASIKAGNRPRFERDVVRKDGSLLPVEMSGRRLADGTIQGIAHDITERRRRESELSLERSLLRALLENIPDYVYFKDTESRFIRTSAAHARAFGLRDAREAVGRTDGDFFSDEHARKAREDERRIILTGEPILNLEERETWTDRKDTWVRTTKMPLRDQEARIVGTFGISHDITEHKRDEERIAGLARFADENPHPVLRASVDGSILYANRSSRGMTTSWGEGAEMRVPRPHLPALGLAWETGERREIVIVEASRTFAVTIVPFASEGYINLYGRDVTEEKALAERLHQMQRIEAIGQLTGGVAHDFNNVLQAISGYCEVLERRVTGENRQYVAEISKAARRAAALTAQLLAFSRKQVLKPQAVDTNELIKSLHAMLERLMGDEIELRTFLEPDTGNFFADPGKMEQVLINLAVNARDAMPSGGTLTIETSNRTFDDAFLREHPGSAPGSYVRVAVTDTGTGMDPQTLSHLYEPFFTTKGVGKGTGLGLSTVYGIIKQSDGHITCSSQVGRGTTFAIYLPLSREQVEKPLAPVSLLTAPRGTETVLLVDDDPAARSVARMGLEGAGYVVVEASGGEEALSEVERRHIAVALLVTDVVMPRMNGKDLALRLGELVPSAKVLYMSGYTRDVISDHGILDEGLDYLEKPFSLIELLTRVRELLDRPV